MPLPTDPLQHVTLRHADRLTLDADGVLIRQDTAETVEALASISTVGQWPYKAMTTGVLLGATGQTAELQDCGDRPYYYVPVPLSPPLEKGEQGAAVYSILYNPEGSRSVGPRYCRNIKPAVGNLCLQELAITVVFAQKPPPEVWWAEWQGYKSEDAPLPGSEELASVSFDEQGRPYVERKLQGLDSSFGGRTFGFYWGE